MKPAMQERKPFRRFEHKTRIPEKLVPEFKKKFSELIGTRSAYILDEDLNIQGKVPVSELSTTLMQLDKIFAVIFDSNITEDIVRACSRKGVKYAVGANADYSGRKSRTLTVVTQKDLE